MKLRLIALILSLVLLLGGCSWLDGSYHSVTPHRAQSGSIRTENLPVTNEEELVENCMELHFLPMREKLVRKPEDYWWSSYLEYRRGTGRRIVHTERVLNYLDEDRKRAMRKFVCLHNSNT